MAEKRWEVKIGSPVMAADAEYGRLQQIIIDPQQGRVVAIIAQRHGLFPVRSIEISTGMIAEATEKEVLITITHDEADKLPDYPSPSSGADGDPAAITLREGQQLTCKDGQPGGKVYLLLMNADGRVTGIVTQTGYLPRRNLIVPIDWIQAGDGNQFNLSVVKSQLEKQPEYRSDDALKLDIDQALWTNETLRNSDYPEISVSVEDGVVELTGHVFNPLNKNRAEEAIRALPGITSIENRLVVDVELAAEVTRSIAGIHLTPSEHVSVSAHHGFITLTGKVNDGERRVAAETAAASLPHVRGIANYLQAPGVTVHPKGKEFWQPQIGECVYATDMLLGNVEQVVINPNNRCVTAFVTHGNFPEINQVDEQEMPNNASQRERDVVIPTRTILFDGDSSIRLMVNGVEAARNRDVSPSDFGNPSEDWQPPYPYRLENVLLAREPEKNWTN